MVSARQYIETVPVRRRNLALIYDAKVIPDPFMGDDPALDVRVIGAIRRLEHRQYRVVFVKASVHRQTPYHGGQDRKQRRRSPEVAILPHLIPQRGVSACHDGGLPSSHASHTFG